jgi:hypothetical protein
MRKLLFTVLLYLGMLMGCSLEDFVETCVPSDLGCGEFDICCNSFGCKYKVDGRVFECADSNNCDEAAEALLDYLCD